MLIRKAIFIFFLFACLVTAPISAEVLCGPGGGEHDTQKYKGQVPKDFQVYGLLDALNRLDASANNKYLESGFERVKEKAQSVQEWYTKRNIKIPEVECVLGQQAQRFIDSLLAKQQAQAQAELLSEADTEEPVYRQWLNESFPDKDAMMAQCVPSRANTVGELNDALVCLNALANTANEEFQEFQGEYFRRFIVTPQRKAEIPSVASSFSSNYNQLWDVVQARIESWKPPAIAQRCFNDVCLGDPISKHAHKLVPVNRTDVEEQAEIIQQQSPMLDAVLSANEKLTRSESLELAAYQALRGGVLDERSLSLMRRDDESFCNGKVYVGKISDGQNTTIVKVGSLIGTSGEPIIGIRALWRNFYDVPRSGPGLEQFEQAVKDRYSDDSIDRFDATSSIRINSNMGPFVQVRFELSSLNYEHYVVPAKASFCGQPKELSW